MYVWGFCFPFLLAFRFPFRSPFSRTGLPHGRTLPSATFVSTFAQHFNSHTFWGIVAFHFGSLLATDTTPRNRKGGGDTFALRCQKKVTVLPRAFVFAVYVQLSHSFHTSSTNGLGLLTNARQGIGGDRGAQLMCLWPGCGL